MGVNGLQFESSFGKVSPGRLSNFNENLDSQARTYEQCIVSKKGQ